MGQVVLQFGIVFLFPTSTALHVAVNQGVVGQFHFVAAVTPAKPYHRIACIPLGQRFYCHQTVEPLAGNVRRRVVFFMGRSAAAGPPPVHQQGAGGVIKLAAAAAAGPPYSPIMALIFRPMEHRQFPEGFSGQIVGQGLPGLFDSQTAAALAAAVNQASLQDLPLGAAGAPAKPSSWVALPRAFTNHRPSAKGLTHFDFFTSLMNISFFIPV